MALAVDMKKVFVLTVLCAAMFVAAGNFELQAQSTGAKDVGRASRAAAPENRTPQEQREHGEMLELTGGMMMVIIAPSVAALGLLVALPLSFFLDADVLTPVGWVAIGVPVAIFYIGFIVWAVGVVNTNEGKRRHELAITLDEREGKPDVLLGFDTEIHGVGVRVRY